MDEKEVLEAIAKAKKERATTLNLYGEDLMTVPPELTQLRNLQVLNLSGTQLTSLPDAVVQLTSLWRLDLSHNQLTSIPKALGRLTNLHVLDLGNNQLTSVPDALGQLTGLERLYLRGNKLESLPDALGQLINLQWLFLDNNRLTSLPDALGQLTNLRWLDLQNNSLTSLPDALGQLTNLMEMALRGNPLESPPPEVIKRGGVAVTNYLRQLQREGRDRLYEAKLLIVGEAGAGKTSLARKVQDPSYELRNDEKSTDGIDVIEWYWLMEGRRDFRVNIWDFGGQEIYHATHQFFLTKRSLYALVADTRKEDTDFNYWLNVVELLSAASPLLIVKNEKQDRQREINESALRGEFGNIKEILTTNLATNRGLPEIRDQIKHELSKLPHVGTQLPITWVKVREALEQDERNYIDVEEYLSICEGNGFRRREDKLQLSSYLHDLGVCLHFQNDELLRKTIILKPEWGTHAVYKLLDHKKVVAAKGRFHARDLEKIWYEPCYADMHAELLRLMINFKLCYQIPHTQEYIVPELLGRNQPQYEWDDSDNLVLRYAYEFMPKGITTQFIVAMHPWIARQDWVWREGVILEKDRTRAEVIESYGRREIKIRVVGRHKRELMTIITHELDRINSTYAKLMYKRLIPCNCEVCRGSRDPHFYVFETLREFAADGQPEIQCQRKPYRMVNVLKLIDGVVEDVPDESDSGVGMIRFAVALSFPGEKREFVGEVAGYLAAAFGKTRVFYDANFKSELARPNLDTYLQHIYHDDSELVTVFLCREYDEKQWCGLEWRAIRDLMKTRRSSEIMLIRFDDAYIPGLFSIDGYIDARDRPAHEIAKQITERYQANRRGQGI